MASQREVGLRQVREDELDALKARLARHLPHSFVVYGSLSLAAHYGLHTLRPASILVPVDPSSSCLTVIASVSSGGPQCIEVFWSPKEHTTKDVADYLSRIPDVDWSQPVLMIGFPNILLQSLNSLDSIGAQRVQTQEKHPSYLYNLEMPAIPGTELPQVYHVSSLKEEEASVVWNNWDFNSMDSEDSIRDDIAHFPSVCIREHNPTRSAKSLHEEAQESLVSWIRTAKTGWMGNTFTLPQHRRRGLASTATLTLARQMVQEGLLANVAIEATNHASIKFHESLGFKQQCAICVLVIVPAEATDQDHLRSVDQIK